MTVVIAGGGTGGHLYPGVAVARELRRRLPDARVVFVGTSRGLEARVVPAEGFPLRVIRSAGLKGKSVAARLRGVLTLPLSLIDAWRVISAERPDVVLGVGGYSSGPVVLLGAWRRVPTMLLEQNAVPGLTNRLLARWVRAAAVSFEETRSWFGEAAFVAGNPVRLEFFQRRATPERARPRRVLALGGSLGAHAINVAMVEAAKRMAPARPDLEVVHQTGARDLAAVRAGYSGLEVTARADAFLDPVADEVHAADLVVCRAGATTIAELAAAGRPAVFVPFPRATDDHQRRNAQVLADAGAAELLEERALTGPSLADAIGRLLDDPARLQAMRQAMRGFARPDAAARIVDRVLDLAR